jgi:hypothetical protein
MLERSVEGTLKRCDVIADSGEDVDIYRAGSFGR